MNLGEIYESAVTRLNKDVSGNIVNIKKFNAIIRLVNIKLFNQKAGLPEEYSPGQPIPRQAIDLNRQISEDLSKFRKRLGGQNALSVFSGGFCEVPADFARLSTLAYNFNSGGKTKRVPVPIVMDSEWDVVLGSPLAAPNLKRPVARINGETFEISPRNITRVDLIYYRWPEHPYFDFVVQNNTEVYLPPGEVHDGTGELDQGQPSRSVDFEFPRTLHDRIVNLIVDEVSVMVRDQFPYQDSAQRKATGQ